jgi:enoyl-[acyl-carrier protein] reductase III
MTSKVVLITGGTRGIGRAIANVFAQKDVHLFLTYLQNEDAAQIAQRELMKSGAADVEVHHTDIRDPKGCEQLINYIQNKYDRLDVLVNNAASGAFRPLAGIKLRHWDFTQDTCVKGPLWLTVRSREILAKAQGTVINISSLGAVRVLDQYGPIGVAKAALESLTRYLAYEFAGEGIRVNAVSGGLIDTSALDTYPRRQELYEKTARETPAGRLVQPRDIAEIVFFLTTPSAEMIRGQVIVVDGGYSLR